jgi:hypothetical protein
MAMRVVPAMDELKHRQLGLLTGSRPLTVDEPPRQSRENVLAHRVISGVADTSH